MFKSERNKEHTPYILWLIESIPTNNILVRKLYHKIIFFSVYNFLLRALWSVK